AAARACSAERRVVRVADRPADGADPEIAERKLVAVRLAEHDRPGAPHARRPAGVEPRPVIDERARATRRRQAEDVDVVLEGDRYGVQRTARAAGGALGVAGARVGDR